MDIVLEDFVASKEGLQLVSVCIFIHTNAGRYEVFGLEGAICDHGEDVDNIMSKAVCMIVTILTIVLHFELTSCHLSDAVVYGLTCVNCSLEVGVFQ